MRSSICLFVPLVALLGSCTTAGSPKDSAAAPAVAALDISELDQVPAPRFQARPDYPAKLKKDKVAGEAVVDFVVDTNGDVIRARALRATHPEFGKSAVDAVQRWKFKPGRKNGRTVATHLQVPIVFAVDNPPSAEAVAAALREATTRTDLQAIDISRLDVKPVALSQARPHYPANLREKHVRGEAVIDFVVDVNGAVKNAVVLRATHPEFGAAALAAVAQWKFKPGMLESRIVNTHMQVPIVFALDER